MLIVQGICWLFCNAVNCCIWMSFNYSHALHRTRTDVGRASTLKQRNHIAALKSGKIKQLCFYDRVSSRRTFAVDEDGDMNAMRSTVTILNQEQEEGIFIDSYSNIGFKLNNGIQIIGPCAVFPRSVLHWNVRMCWHFVNYLTSTIFSTTCCIV